MYPAPPVTSNFIAGARPNRFCASRGHINRPDPSTGLGFGDDRLKLKLRETARVIPAPGFSVRGLRFNSLPARLTKNRPVAGEKRNPRGASLEWTKSRKPNSNP